MTVREESIESSPTHRSLQLGASLTRVGARRAPRHIAPRRSTLLGVLGELTSARIEELDAAFARAMESDEAVVLPSAARGALWRRVRP